MKTVKFVQRVRQYVNVPDYVAETKEAIMSYMDSNGQWPDIIEGDFEPIESVEVIERDVRQ